MRATGALNFLTDSRSDDDGDGDDDDDYSSTSVPVLGDMEILCTSAKEQGESENTCMHRKNQISSKSNIKQGNMARQAILSKARSLFSVYQTPV